MVDYINKIDKYLKKLFPLTRSITGNGNRETLRYLKEIVPLEIKELKSGTDVYDWKIPREWNVENAWIKDKNGNVLIDFMESNLHLVSYSEPINKILKLSELKNHLHKHKTIPEAIPYRTSYYKQDWGFCVTHDQYDEICNRDPDEKFHVLIDSEFNENGSLSLGELIIPGKSKKEFLISTYICHPSMANDNLSGTIMTAFMAKELLNESNLFYTYRIIWVPETIGAIAYSFFNEKNIKAINHGLEVTTVGGRGSIGYKQSFDSSDILNLIIEEVLKNENIDYIKYPFDIHGSDERQFSSIGFRINMPLITKDKYYEYDYYHSSLDDLNYVSGKDINKTLNLYLKTIKTFEKESLYVNKLNFCEAMLSKYDLYPKLGAAQLPSKKVSSDKDIILWLLHLCDGKYSISQISKKIGVSKNKIVVVADMLCAKGLLQKIK